MTNVVPTAQTAGTSPWTGISLSPIGYLTC
jgi:hypothetical protein